ncbi:hypothetical protein AHF37_09616 [Paragonimus kellicotti]|nr:hypothetical protein AHF37_09616 [Paragonimus kellicotti]
MLEKMLRSKSGIDRSPNDDTKSLACLPFMAPYRTLTDFDTGEVILMSEEKRKTAVLSTLTIFTDALSFQIRRNHSGEFASKASLEEAWSHISTVDLDESLRTVPMVAQSSPQKVLGTILNPTSSTSSK